MVDGDLRIVLHGLVPLMRKSIVLHLILEVSDAADGDWLDLKHLPNRPASSNGEIYLSGCRSCPSAVWWSKVQQLPGQLWPRTMGHGVNAKAQQGRERKAAQKEACKREEERKREKAEEKEWAVGAKQVSAKRVEEEAKRLAKANAKKERGRLEAEEQKELEKYKPPSRAKGSSLVGKAVSSPSVPSIMGAGRSVADSNTSVAQLSDSDNSSLFGASEAPIYSASDIDNAIMLMESATGSSKSTPIERHPERRVKAAYMEFSERELPILKAEHPELRMTQLRERLDRMWAKSPENPFNQVHISYRATKTQEELHAEKAVEYRLERMRLNQQ